MDETTSLKQRSPEEPGVWMHSAFILMTFVTGMIDAASYLGLGRVFTANMTGNVVLLGFAAATVPGLSVVRSLTALGFALLGGVLAGRLQAAFRLRNKRRWMTASGGTETLLLLAASLVALHWGAKLPLSTGAEIAIIALTACSMGVRNGTLRHLAVPDITTTVLTLTVAALSSESVFGGGSNPRWRRRVGAIIAMLMGAYAGAILLRVSLAAVLGTATSLVLAVAILQHAFMQKETDDFDSAPTSRTLVLNPQ